MLSQLLFVRLKAAENALRDGRLDEAYRLATAPDTREHRRGAAVLSALTDRFTERARAHFRADRFSEAMLDLDKAEAGGAKQLEIAELRANIRTVMSEKQRRDRDRRNRLEEARRRVEDGSLAAGKQILDEASNSDWNAQALREAAEARARDAAVIVEQAERLLDQGQLTAAAQRLKRAKSIDAHGEAVTRLEARICGIALQNAHRAICEGKLSRGRDELSCLMDLGRALPARRELEDMLTIVSQAAHCVREGRYGDARRHVMVAVRLLPEAGWLQSTVEQLKQAEDAFASLISGPLGEGLPASPQAVERPVAASPRAPFAGDPMAAQGRGKRGQPMDRIANSPARERRFGETLPLPRDTYPESELPRRLLLLIDGGGSYLMLRGERITIGRAASSDPADVPIFSDVAERHANVARVDDDYFLFSGKDVEIGGERTRHQLLRDGDRVVLGRKAKLRFHLPSRKSTSAVLDLSDTTKIPNDVRRVVLFHRNATIGPGSTAHVRCQPAGPSLVMFERDGALWLRQKSDGHVDTDAVPLRLGQAVEIAGVSLVLRPWEMRKPGSRVI